MAFSRRALERLLLNGIEIAGVCTLEASAFNADHSDLRDIAIRHGIPCRYAPNINDPSTLAWIRDLRPDVVFCFGWSRLLGDEVLAVAPLGVIGFHPAALPANRGRHPIIWALALGLEETASTFFFMDGGADSGDILAQDGITITTADTAGSLYEKVCVTALQQIDRFVPQLVAGTFPRTPQDHGKANTWRKRGRADGEVDWRMSANSVYNLVRALSRPYVGAHFLRGTGEIKVWRCEIVTGVPLNTEPGKVLARDARGAVIRCGHDGVRLLETEPPFQPEIGEYL